MTKEHADLSRRWLYSHHARDHHAVRTIRFGGLMIATLLGASGSHAMTDAPQAPGSAATASRPYADQRGNQIHLGIDNRLGDLLRHPAFAGIGKMVLPWDDRSYDESMTLRQLGALMPYHSHVEPEVVVRALNRMIDDVAGGETIFFRFYTAAERLHDPTKENAGLFFFRGRPGAPFAIIAPGGGFAYVGSLHEGFPYAMEISRHGYNAFVLRYRAGVGERAATEDLAAALSFLFRNAAELRIDTAGYSVWGSSAGARMAANIGSYGTRPFGGEASPKPSLVVMAYTGHSGYAAGEPPTFVVVGDQDGIAPPAVMERRVAALRAQGTLVQYRKYPNVGHGFGLGTGTSADGWIGDAVRFWSRIIERN